MSTTVNSSGVKMESRTVALFIVVVGIAAIGVHMWAYFYPIMIPTYASVQTHINDQYTNPPWVFFELAPTFNAGDVIRGTFTVTGVQNYGTIGTSTYSPEVCVLPKTYFDQLNLNTKALEQQTLQPCYTNYTYTNANSVYSINFTRTLPFADKYYVAARGTGQYPNSPQLVLDQLRIEQWQLQQYIPYIVDAAAVIVGGIAYKLKD